MSHTRNFTLDSTSKLPAASQHCDLQGNTLASKAVQEESAMEYDACIMVLFRAGIHESSEIVRTLARVSWFEVLPYGERGDRGNIKDGNGVTG